MSDIKTASMNQGQRTRYLKAGGLIAFVLMIFWFMSPGKTYISMSHNRLAVVPPKKKIYVAN